MLFVLYVLSSGVHRRSLLQFRISIIKIAFSASHQGRKYINGTEVKNDDHMTSAPNSAMAMVNPLTQEGGIVGTAPYMSPEQLESKPVDARSDIFSLGIIMYEMLTGERPFTGDTSMAVMSSVLKDTPPRVTDVKLDLPPHLDLIISGCLEKKVDDRPQTAKGVRNNLRMLQKDLTSDSLLQSGPRLAAPNRGKPAWMIPVLVAAAVILAGGGTWFLKGGQQGSPNLKETVALTVAPAKDERKMIAVLPFENLGNSQDEYFADGLTEEIISRLAGIKGLGVISRSSVMQYKGKTTSLKDIGHEQCSSHALSGRGRQC